MPSKRFLSSLLFLALFGLVASGQQLTYLLAVNPPTVISPGSTVPVPNTNVGSTGDITIQIVNSSTSNITLGNIGVTGAGFQLTQFPPLPAILTPGSSRTVTVTFAPTKAGTANASLAINSDIFFLSGVGLAPQLVFSYVTAGTTVTINATNTAVVFSPLVIGQSAQLLFDAKNNGTLPAVISNIGVAQGSSPFSLVGLPALPVTLAPGEDIQFFIKFKPTALGFANGTLQMDTTTIPLIGSGTQPPTLPSYTIDGVSGQVAPRSQLKVSLTLGNPYPVAISGVLTLATSGTLPNDPAVQFASGGRTVAFAIPADSTSAVFGSFGTSIAFQTGTVASTITFTPAFTTQAGAVDITPQTPTTLQVTVGSAAPNLIGIQLANGTANGFSIVVTGFSTTRTLTSWTVDFATAPGFNMTQTKFTLDLQQVSNVWFQGAASQAFGGQFTITVPFTLTGTLPSGAPLVSALSSVSVSVSNALGSSNNVQAKLQ